MKKKNLDFFSAIFILFFTSITTPTLANDQKPPEKDFVIVLRNPKMEGPQRDNWSCGVFAASKVLKFFNYRANYFDLKDNHAQKVFGLFLGAVDPNFDGGLKIGVNPDRLVILINSYVAEVVAERIKNGTLITKAHQARVVKNTSIDSIKHEIIHNQRPVIALIRDPISGELHWFTIIGWSNNEGFLIADSNLKQKYWSVEKFSKAFYKFFDYFTDPILKSINVGPGTTVMVEPKEFNTIDAIFDTLLYGAEKIIYKVPALGEIYNFHKLGVETTEQIVNYGLKGVSHVLGQIGIPIRIPNFHIPLTLSAIVSVKNDVKKHLESTERDILKLADNIAAHPDYQNIEREVDRTAIRVEQEIKRVGDQVAAETKRTLNRVGNEMARWFGW